MTKVLIVGSGHSATEYYDYEYKKNGWSVIAVSNAWRLLREEFDVWVAANDYKGDFPKPFPHQTLKPAYTHILDQYGGHLACGYSITLNASYYALNTYVPKTIGYLGCDMNYQPNVEGKTHFYGIGEDIIKRGISDPDRMAKYYGKDKADTYIHDIYSRFAKVANDYGTTVVNLSSETETRLPYPKASPLDI